MRRGLAGPLVIIVLGLIFLAYTLGFDPPIGVFARDFWPFLLIVIGVMHIGRHFASGFGSRPGTLMSGVVLITLGVLFALQQLADIPFRVTWPVLLIVTGIAGLLQFTGSGGGFGGRWYRGGFRR